MAATWTWQRYFCTFASAIGSSATAACTIPVPSGSSIQRVIVQGGFNVSQVVSSPVGAGYPAPAQIIGELTVTANPAVGPQHIPCDQQYVWDQRNEWSRESGTQVDYAVYLWATPAHVHDFDARIRFKGGSNANVQVVCSAIVLIPGNPTIAVPTGQPSGHLSVLALMSS